jgi:hypothetical protein
MAKKNNKKQSIARVRGQGGYYTDKVVPVMQNLIPKGTFQKFGGVAGGMAGTALTGNPAGGLVGASGGRALGAKIAKILGFGDYSVVENSISTVGKAIMPGEPVPEFGTSGNETRVRHREYIGDIVVPASPTTFTNTSYVINPGDKTTFPWLSSLAQQYQQYKFNGLIFEFKTLTSEVATGGPMGAVILATNYDVLENPFPDKIRMENAQFSVSAKPSCSQIHTIECASAERASRLLYIRNQNSSTTASQDARWNDLGKFQLATAGLAGSAGQVLGELWASYDVSLYKPEIATPLVVGEKVSGASSVSKTAIFGTAPVLTGTVYATADTNTLIFQIPGEYLVTSSFSTTVGTQPVITGTAQINALALAESALDVEITYRVRVTAVGQTLIQTMSGSASVTGTTVRIAPYQYTLA